MVVSAPSAFLAVDWGTTNRRVFRFENGAVAHTERDDRGAASVTDFAGEVAAIRDRFGDLPMLLAGMVGSTVGWRVVPYVTAPAGIDQLVAGLDWIDDRTAIVPGVSCAKDGRADVMRGEEVQLLGAVAGWMVPPDALLAQPGTHCKWATMADGRISGFTTAMTGELFALLRGHSLLAGTLTADVTDGDAFREGLAEGARRDLAASLFGIRAASVLGLRNDADAASFASGVLIGSDVAARMDDCPFEQIHILADPQLGNLYAAAVAATGREPVIVDSHSAFARGILAIGEKAL
ncbi:2-dehydro-3-deoxygalactonokinase [Sphingopyxis sp.]|uniref:2-dehydro-3-deoxygalactonokinase n=1 Tax=Sphingopyxis sp. TaxID=1908224 RepID=UPI002D78BFDD|nr:2-dehydro-3-deoxygalactonokinase [Sphingopyxis sp.]HET6524897.1 2-dehydro-3-deoxygalactonokinase [Sphingopyxis sp.]